MNKVFIRFLSLVFFFASCWFYSLIDLVNDWKLYFCSVPTDYSATINYEGVCIFFTIANIFYTIIVAICLIVSGLGVFKYFFLDPVAYLFKCFSDKFWNPR
jgi:hypothetical protein